MLDNISSRSRTWLGAGGIFVLIVMTVGATFVLQGMIRTQLDEDERLMIHEQIVSEALQSLPTLKQQYRIYSDQKERLNIVATQESLVQAVESIEAAARGSELRLNITEEDPLPSKGASLQVVNQSEQAASSTPTKPDQLTDHLAFPRSVHLRLTVEGSYEHIVQFLHKLETASYANDVIGLDLAYQEKTETVQDAPRASTTDNPFLLNTVADTQQATEQSVEKRGEVVGLIDLLMYTK